MRWVLQGNDFFVLKYVSLHCNKIVTVVWAFAFKWWLSLVFSKLPFKIFLLWNIQYQRFTLNGSLIKIGKNYHLHKEGKQYDNKQKIYLNNKSRTSECSVTIYIREQLLLLASVFIYAVTFQLVTYLVYNGRAISTATIGFIFVRRAILVSCLR